MRVTLLGAGAWGTALAVAVADRHPTWLWVRDAAQAQALRHSRENQRYLPGVGLPAALCIGSDLDAALAHSVEGGLTLIATPMAGLRERLADLAARGDARPVAWLCKGFEAGTGLLGHEIARALRPDAACGVLSGPSFAQEVAQGRPTAVLAASADAGLVQALVSTFHSDALRVYAGSDLVGVEVGGALKNVLAIAAGILDGMPAAGLNARAALVTRGLAEMTRLGVALGGRAETLMGLSGLGDLVLTATGDLSRNRRVGLLLASGLSLGQALAQLGHVAEGVPAAAVALARAQALGLDLPITEAVVQVLRGELAPAAAMSRLMMRQSRSEWA